MAHTTEELAIQVMRLPGWLDAQEEPESADAAFITNTYSDFYAEWKLKDLAYWPIGAIPDEVFQYVARIIADAVAPAFGDAAPTEFDIVSGVQVSMGYKGWTGLTRVITRERSGLSNASTYF